ncbi:hypothetical protein [Streptomyces sp. ms115]|uniref:hypothetical protein n=1 Tax=Streptomyces sp. ms115 TaxID=1827928 RepID=UPI00211D62B3|nr:hypothetical protein [Streptomyces sp. ms115]
MAVFHLVQPHDSAALTDLAVWRYRSYASDLPWARDKIRELLEGDHAGAPNPEYVLSRYCLTTDELVACELTVQALWCFTRYIQQMVGRTAQEALRESAA